MRLYAHYWFFLAALLDFLVWSLESRRPWKIGWRSRCRNRAWPLNSDIVFCSRRRDLKGDEFPNRWCSASLSSCLKGCDHCINFIWNKVDWNIRFLFFFEPHQALACTEIDDGQCREVFLFACHLSVFCLLCVPLYKSGWVPNFRTSEMMTQNLVEGRKSKICHVPDDLF